MFTDRVKIYLKAGNGGNGCASFRRERFVPKGGPDGGNGGKGGDIVFRADRNLSTLLDFYYRPHLKAKRGAHGGSSNKSGKTGKSLTVTVPLGTQLVDPETSVVLYDFLTDGEKKVIAKGGRGGRGNASLTSPTNPLPREAESGQEGEELTLRLELKLLADIGLVGFPNAGKSTLISHISSARPKIASYPFTTLSPVLGTVKYDFYKEIVVADIPGIIEGAHDDIGLGHEFLRHIERTKALVFVIDMSTAENRDPVDDYRVLEKELRFHNPDLITRPRLVAANKMDIEESKDQLDQFIKSGIHDKNLIYPISAASGMGLQELTKGMIKILDQIKKSL